MEIYHFKIAYIKIKHLFKMYINIYIYIYIYIYTHTYQITLIWFNCHVTINQHQRTVNMQMRYLFINLLP